MEKLKYNLWIERVKNPDWFEADQWVIYKYGGTTEHKSIPWLACIHFDFPPLLRLAAKATQCEEKRFEPSRVYGLHIHHPYLFATSRARSLRKKMNPPAAKRRSDKIKFCTIAFWI